MNIHDHGENDPIPFELTDADRAIADQCKHAIVEQRYYLNTRDKLQQRAQAEHEQVDRGMPFTWPPIASQEDREQGRVG